MELVLLTLTTFGFVIGFAYLNIRAMEKLRKEDGPKSTLSEDGAAEWLEKNGAKS